MTLFRASRPGAPAAVCALLAQAAILACPTAAFALQGPQDLSRLTLEELAEVEITSVSRRPEQLSQAASAIFVITADDIRRSGATSLPELLRLAPNLHVRRINTGDYAITARGFNGFESANKLLVLVDGRSIYEPLHSGVLWDGRSLMLATIERIEVISGPGGALHGANAVNGVINIITRPAAATQGEFVSAVAGDDERTLGYRHGGEFGETGAYRVYLYGFERDSSRTLTEDDAHDRVQGLRAGFRGDAGAEENRLTLQGDVFKHEVQLDTDVTGGNLLGRWIRLLEGGGVLEAQGYFDRSERESADSRARSNTYDIHLQHTLPELGRHRLVWGGGHRWIEDFLVAPGSPAFLDPPERRITLGNLFLQDQMRLSDDLTLTLGVKVEESSYSGGEILPSARLAWRRPSSLWWAAVSRAVRTPNRLDRDLVISGVLEPGPFGSEAVIAYEAGWRASPTPSTSVSISAFYNVYDGLRTVAPPPGEAAPLHFTNGGEGETLGVEAWGSVDLTPWWRMSAGLSTLDKDLRLSPGQVDFSRLSSFGSDPGYQVLLRSQVDIGERTELDVRVRAVDSLERPEGDNYVDLDVRLGWRINERAEFALVGQNLLDEYRRESDDPARARLIGRSFHAAIRMGF